MYKNKTKAQEFKIAAFYNFKKIPKISLKGNKDKLDILCKENDIRGTILVASEGINGTICGINDRIDLVVERVKLIFKILLLEVKISWAERQAFRRLKIKIKTEIVTMGIKGLDPKEEVGKYIEANEWNNIIEDENTLLIDTRNDYEVSIGTFKNAINPKTDKFRDFPEWVDSNLSSELNDNPRKKIAMFCTGGIRCEKATAYLLKKGFKDVYHLKGGILKYLEEIPQDKSKWEGECFVFDQRVSLDQNLVRGSHELCFACGMPLSKVYRERENYIEGIQCDYCINKYNDDDRERFSERQKMIDKYKKEGREF